MITTIFASIVLSACLTDTTSIDIPIESIENKNVDTIATLKAILNGDWVEPSYIDDIKKTKSPYKSKDALSSIVELNINMSQMIGDSLEIGSPSIHEGISFYVFFRPGILANSFQTSKIDYDNESNFYDLGYLISNKDTSVVIYHFDKNEKLLGQSEFKKVPKNSQGALQYMVNKSLVAGKYSTKDPSGKSITVQFTNDGLVIGMPEFKKYYVLTDFVAGPLNNLDEICFDIQTKNQKCYAYEIKGDTINLYESIENEDYTLLSFGQLKYKLTKQ